MGSYILDPLICLGDFNELVWHHEKLGGGCSMGQKFTWICVNGWAVEIHERLDRAVMNVKWQEVYPNSMVSHCARVGSDHCSILIGSMPCGQKRKRVFIFESFWAEDAQCGVPCLGRR
ncbi:hypothetical protein GBA52_028686 [Prunus armeniaca]|nr:hypothetical protein GBA52_028686 [Prunus armeniaca]